MSLSRLDPLRRATALLVAWRSNWLEQAFGATPNAVRQTLEALVAFIFRRALGRARVTRVVG